MANVAETGERKKEAREGGGRERRGRGRGITARTKENRKHGRRRKGGIGKTGKMEGRGRVKARKEEERR